MSLETNYNKKQLADRIKENEALIEQLKDKLKEMKGVEQQVVANAETMPEKAVGIIKDGDNYCLVKLKYDPVTNAAVVTEKEVIGKDAQLAAYNLQKFVAEQIYIPLVHGRKYK